MVCPYNKCGKTWTSNRVLIDFFFFFNSRLHRSLKVLSESTHRLSFPRLMWIRHRTMLNTTASLQCPPIIFLKNSSEVGRVVGANVGKIQSLIKTHEGGSSFGGTGQTLGGGGNSSNSNTTSGSPSNRKRGSMDNAPYHIKLWTAFVSPLES